MSVALGSVGQQPIALPAGRFGTVASLLANLVDYNVKDFGATGDGGTDDSAAIQRTLDAAALSGQSGARIRFPMGTYKVTTTLFVTADRQFLMGDGRWTTTIAFTPATAKACFLFRATNPALVLYQPTICDMGFVGGGAQQKIALDFWDCSEAVVYNIVTFSTWTGNSGNAATPSIAIRTQGREFLSVDHVQLAGDRPVHLMKCINGGANHVDHFNFHNCYLITLVTTEAAYLLDPDVNPTNLKFTGYQSTIAGKYAIRSLPNVGGSTGQIVQISGGRYEQGADPTGQTIRWEGAMQQFVVDSVNLGGPGGGMLLRNVRRITLSNVLYPPSAGVALDIDGTCDDLSFTNCFYQAGTTVSLAGFEEVDSVPKVVAGSPLPPSGRWVRTGTTGRYVGRFGTRDSRRSIVIAVGGNYLLEMGEDGLLKTGHVHVSAYSATGPISEFGIFHVDPTGVYLDKGTANMAAAEIGGKLGLAFGAINNIVLVNHLAAPVLVCIHEVWTT